MQEDPDSIPPVSDQPVLGRPVEPSDAVVFRRSLGGLATTIAVLAWLAVTLLIALDRRSTRLSHYFVAAASIVPTSLAAAAFMRRRLALSISATGLQGPDTRGRRITVRFDEHIEVRYRQLWFIRQLELKTPRNSHPLVVPLFMGVPRLMRVVAQSAGSGSAFVCTLQKVPALREAAAQQLAATDEARHR